MRLPLATAVVVAMACGPSPAEQVLADLLSGPHECWLEDEFAASEEALGDCYRRVVWSQECGDTMPTLDTSAVVAVIPTYSFVHARSFSITDADTLEAFVAEIPFSGVVEPPEVDFATHFVAGVYDRQSTCAGNSLETGVYLDGGPPRVYYRFHDVTGACATQCDGIGEAVYLYRIPRVSGFPTFCIDHYNTC